MRANDCLLHMNKTLTRQQLDNGVLSFDYIRRIRTSQKGISEDEERKLVNAKITNRGDESYSS